MTSIISQTAARIVAKLGKAKDMEEIDAIIRKAKPSASVRREIAAAADNRRHDLARAAEGK